MEYVVVSNKGGLRERLGECVGDVVLAVDFNDYDFVVVNLFVDESVVNSEVLGLLRELADRGPCIQYGSRVINMQSCWSGDLDAYFSE